MNKKLMVDLKKTVDYSYFIYFRPFVPDYENAYFLIDSNVYHFHKYRFNSLENVFIFESSEKNKNFDNVQKVLSWLRENRCKRHDTLVVVGGGIVGDLGGFAASIYMRGINFVQVPTTLLSMVDSSVGGKTGINFHDTKNLIGAFKQPIEVVIDTSFLDTLPEVEYQNGLAEVLKYGLMFDKQFADFLNDNYDSILNKTNDNVIADMIYKCCKIKGEVVKEDEFEQGIRKFLNFGHTIGHAIEVDSDHKIKHGYAVAIGMYLESLIGMELGELDEDTVYYVKKLLLRYNFDIDYKIKDSFRFLDALTGDKKAESYGIVLSLTNPIGAGKIIKGVSIDFVMKILKKYGVLNG
ncbi:3-dehydroquinate synthase [Deferribacter desulfuricans SSM1]|uniref:3-dehydroquinate synthase n=1 Tax=Deferribacter desulfuricans (strain DSM 14783 / JCM 11476 / NBRC 101012 / SSM1) TaxID=639282 RepID=D3PBH1_DEFDS|nr:3-dehydroquinate synthase [Deferribacter desulfuricans]BAI79944.1 3-dehydroquinate synthase [Deferribacter desulfuricans SSM1]